jgi:AraC-like DNA-binding protein
LKIRDRSAGSASYTRAVSPFPTSKGHLNPGGGLRMTRVPPGPDAVDLVRHYWIPQWEVPAGHTERQVVLGYPACNLVVEPEGVTLSGPTTKVSHRDLTGTSWAVAALLRPAAGQPLLQTVSRAGAGHPVTAVGDLVDREMIIGDDDLCGSVPGAMVRGRVDLAVAALQEFLLRLRPAVTPDGLLANRLQELVEQTAVRRVEDLAAELALSPRSLQRLARGHIGLSPGAMIRRRRLQDAADEVRRQPDADLTEVALRHGYADHAHLTREFRTVLGFTPSQYRAGR